MRDDSSVIDSGVDRAALAFSLLPKDTAEVVNRRLSVGERMRLREGLSRMRDASDAQRMAAIRALATSVKRGLEWPRPSVHDESDCPFTIVVNQPRALVVDMLERIAAREPLEVAVTLCHLPAEPRETFWQALSAEARSNVLASLDEVHFVSTVRTRSYARDITARLSRERRLSPRSV
jgi:hypothetical protein